MGNYFADNLKYIREKKHLSKNKLSEMVGVNQSTITRWEEKEMTPSIDNVEEVANILKVSLPDMIIKDLKSEKYNTENKTTFNFDDLSDEEAKELLRELFIKNNILDENDMMTKDNYEKFMKLADLNKDFLMNKQNDDT